MIELRNTAAAVLAAGILAILSAAPTLGQSDGEGVAGTIVRFSAGGASVDVTIGEDNPTVRDFLSRLPLTMTIEEFAGREKIGYFDSRLETAGSPGSDPEDGDLIYFTPWGNIGFYYNAAGIDYSDQTIHLGTYDATADELEMLESGPVSVDIVD